MAARSAHARRRSQEIGGLMIPLGHRRSSSQSDNTSSPHATPSQSQTHLQVPPGPGVSSSSSHALGDITSASSASERDRHGDHKRHRAFLADLLSGSHPNQNKLTHPHLPAFVPPHIIPGARAHLRAESLPSSTRDTPSPIPMSAPQPPPKIQSSPSKVRLAVQTPSVHISVVVCLVISSVMACHRIAPPRLVQPLIISSLLHRSLAMGLPVCPLARSCIC